jgi:hypothetical protein
MHRTMLLILALALALFAAQLVNGRITAGDGKVAAAVGPCNNDLAFFGSAPTNTKFHPGDTWQGGTFTSIVVNNPNHNDVMNVRIVSNGDKVGRFPGVAGGSTATITFAQPVQVTGILWFGNDPEAGESGWFINNMPGPNTGDAGAACTATNFVTDTITIWTDDSGGVDFYIDQPPPPDGGGNEGCTPGYWKNHQDSWAPTGYTTGQTVESVFDVPDAYGLDNMTLLQALQGGGGPSVADKARILLRAAVASLLNSAHPGVDFALSTGDVISQVNAALATGNKATIIGLASDLDAKNNAGCPLN